MHTHMYVLMLLYTVVTDSHTNTHMLMLFNTVVTDAHTHRYMHTCSCFYTQR